MELFTLGMKAVISATGLACVVVPTLPLIDKVNTKMELFNAEVQSTSGINSLDNLSLSIFKRSEQDFDFVGELLGKEKFDMQFDKIEEILQAGQAGDFNKATSVFDQVMSNFGLGDNTFSENYCSSLTSLTEEEKEAVIAYEEKTEAQEILVEYCLK